MHSPVLCWVEFKQPRPPPDVVLRFMETSSNSNPMNKKNQVFIWNELKQSLEHWIEIEIGFSAIKMRYIYGKNKRFNNSNTTNL